MSTRSKLAALLALAVAAVVSFAILVRDTLTTVMVNGPAYEKITVAKDVVADVLPPHEFIEEHYLLTFQMLWDSAAPTVQLLGARADRLRAEYFAQQEHWCCTLAEGPLKLQLCAHAHRPANEYFDAWDREFYASLLAGDWATAAQVAHGKLRIRYEEHRAAILDVVHIARESSLRLERETASLIHERNVLLLVVGTALVGMLFAVGWLISRYMAEELIRRIGDSELLTRTILDTAHDAVVIMDAEGRIEDWNLQAESVFGWRRSEAIGRPLVETIVPERYREAHLRGVRLFFESGESRILNKRIEVGALDREGRELPVELTITAVNTAGKITFTAFVRDITERKRSERALSQAMEDLEHRNQELQEARDTALHVARLKSEFLANMSHEIRTPMNGVIGMTSLILDTELNEEQRGYAETISTASEALLEIINDILDFSKIEAGKLDLEVVDFDLGTTVEDVVELLAEKAHRKGLELLCSIDPEMPMRLCGDPGRLRQVLMNLVGNALKFTEKGEVVVRVEAMESADDHVIGRFTVKDTGIGIAPEILERLFSSFTQADGSITRRFGGTGLGLAISKQLAMLMGGDIGVDSKSGEGSTFWFTACLGKATSLAPATQWAADLRGRRALIVDDNATNREILERLLGKWGLERRSVSDPTQGLEILRAAAAEGSPFDVAILDMVMAGMDGVDLLKVIRGDPLLSGLRTILCTSLGRGSHPREAREAGADACLTKPIRQAQLKKCLVLVLAPPAAPGETTKETTVELSAREKKPIEASSRALARVLVAEDNPVNQRLAVRMLEKLGYRADVAANGIEVLSALERIPYDGILMDCQMPAMDGYEATRRVREGEAAAGAGARHLPIIAMTANALQGDRERCLASGMDDYVSKPVRLETLSATLARWLAREPGSAAESLPEATTEATKTT